MATEILKERLVKELEKLPEDRLREVLDFVGYLLVKEREKSSHNPPDDLNPRRDPILKFIGGIAHGALVKRIDEELYGS
ncbi:MAG: DUF2281 domain-containing protein [bacterium]